MSIDFSSPAELRRMTPSELRKELSVKRAEAAKMRIGLTMQKEKNSALYRRIRREIAQILFILSEMERGATAPKSAKEQAESPSQDGEKSVQHPRSVLKTKRSVPKRKTT